MNDKPVWIACHPVDASPSNEVLADATHLSFNGAPAWAPSWSWRDGYVKRSRSGRLLRVLVRTLAGDPNRLASSTLSYFDPEHAPSRVVSPFGLLETESGLALAAPWLNGLDLETLQKRLRMLGAPLPPALALEIGVQLLEILAQLDAFGKPGSQDGAFVHGSIRPSTIHVGIDGHVYLVDVGPERAVKSRNARSKEPAATFCLPYLAPEQLAEGGHEVPQTDLYSVAVVVYELIAGKPLFNGSAARRELEIRAGFGIQERLSAMASEVPGLSEVLSKALNLAPEDRFDSSAIMKEELAALRGRSRSTQLAAVVQDLKVFKPSVRQSRTVVNRTSASVSDTTKNVRAYASFRAPSGTRRDEGTPPRRHPRSSHRETRRSHFILGIIGAAVAIAAYAFVTIPTPGPSHHTSHIDRAVKTYPANGSTTMASPEGRGGLVTKSR